MEYSWLETVLLFLSYNEFASLQCLVNLAFTKVKMIPEAVFLKKSIGTNIVVKNTNYFFCTEIVFLSKVLKKLLQFIFFKIFLERNS